MAGQTETMFNNNKDADMADSSDMGSVSQLTQSSQMVDTIVLGNSMIEQQYHFPIPGGPNQFHSQLFTPRIADINNSFLSDQMRDVDERSYGRSLPPGSASQSSFMAADAEPVFGRDLLRLTPTLLSYFLSCIEEAISEAIEPDQPAPDWALGQIVAKINNAVFMFTPEGLADLEIITSLPGIKRLLKSKWTTVTFGADTTSLPPIEPIGQNYEELSQMPGGLDRLTAAISAIAGLGQVKMKPHSRYKPPNSHQNRQCSRQTASQLVSRMFGFVLTAISRSRCRIHTVETAFSPMFSISLPVGLLDDELPQFEGTLPEPFRFIRAIRLQIDPAGGRDCPSHVPRIRSFLRQCPNITHLSLSIREYSDGSRRYREAVMASCIRTILLGRPDEAIPNPLRTTPPALGKLECLDLTQVSLAADTMHELVRKVQSMRILSLRRVVLIPREDDPETVKREEHERSMSLTTRTGPVREVSRPVVKIRMQSVGGTGVISAISDGNPSALQSHPLVLPLTSSRAARARRTPLATATDDELVADLLDDESMGQITGLRLETIGDLKFLVHPQHVRHCESSMDNPQPFNGTIPTLVVDDVDDYMDSISNLCEDAVGDEFWPTIGWGVYPDQSDRFSSVRIGDIGWFETPRFPISKLRDQIEYRAVTLIGKRFSKYGRDAGLTIEVPRPSLWGANSAW